MKALVINCQNMPCPQPIMKLIELFKKERPLVFEIILDNQAAFENVGRFLNSRGYLFDHTVKDGLWYLRAHTDQEAAPLLSREDEEEVLAGISCFPDGEEMRTLLVITSPLFGKGDDELGEKLMKNFLATLPELGSTLWRIIILNGGVKLAVEGSSVIKELKALEEAGVSILVCGTCLEHFSLTAKRAVGESTNMLDVVSSMQFAHKIIHV